MRRALLLLAVLALSSCSGSRIPDGRSAAYTPGLPDFDLDAIPILSRDASAVEALVSIPHASLVFTRDSSGFRAVLRLALTLRGSDGAVVATPSLRDTVHVASFEETITYAPVLLREPIPAPPGRYTLEAEVEDAATGQRALRRVSVQLPSPEAEASVGPARLDGLPVGRDAFETLVSLGIPTGLDSLRVRFEVFNAPGPLVATARLFRLRADSSVAVPPMGFTPSRGSILSRGVDDRRPDTVFVSRQLIGAPDVSLTVEQALPNLRPGVYSLRLGATVEETDEPIGESERVFVVRPPGFPALTGLRDLVGPLQYLATPAEWNTILAAPEDSLRQAFDAFWGAHFQDRRLAAATFRAFYERVEEANRLFSNHKDGWKTDRGMVYVLFGPPERTEDRFETEVWIYGPRQSLGRAVFERTARRARDGVPFDVFVLQRDRSYDASWRRALRQWRSGQVP
ncbi:MAG: GWxTD domain-containing protein [Bacteroidota bacterium]